MSKLKEKLNYFTVWERLLWSISVLLIVGSFVLFDRGSYLSLCASLIGATSLIFCAKGNPVGQVLMIVFSLLYGWISFSFRYYGEMLTYLGMTAPMALVALISWLRNPYKGNRAEVRVRRLHGREALVMLGPALVVTGVFYFILAAFDTANLIPSTLSVTTSFIAVYLSYKRSPLFALAYASNDVVLIVLWVMACVEDISYLSVVICFVIFLVNDLYGFWNWMQMQKRQENDE